MTREDILQETLSINSNNYLLELATGSGKTKIAIEILKNKLTRGNILIVVPRNVHKDTWAEEVKQWWPNCPLNIKYTTYVSFPKYKGNWDAVIYDECHHLSERCREAICDFNVKYNILCSATVGWSLRDKFKELFDNLVVCKKDLRDMIENNILPDPKVYLWPLKLNTNYPTECIWRNLKAKGSKIIECSFAERWKYFKQKTYPVRVYCTEQQYYSDLCSQIDYWKKKHQRTRSKLSRNVWLKLCNDRLKWLSDKKVKYLHQLLPELIKYRTLTFCNNIEQTELLGEYCINSKNDSSAKNLKDFNEGKIDHITACNILNEGVNLNNCQIGIYNNLNSSETIVKQRAGRLLRHPNPVIIIPYYKYTREEELLEAMLNNYNPELITTISDIKEIKI